MTSTTQSLKPWSEMEDLERVIACARLMGWKEGDGWFEKKVAGKDVVFHVEESTSRGVGLKGPIALDGFFPFTNRDHAVEFVEAVVGDDDVLDFDTILDELLLHNGHYHRFDNDHEDEFGVTHFNAITAPARLLCEAAYEVAREAGKGGG